MFVKFVQRECERTNQTYLCYLFIRLPSIHTDRIASITTVLPVLIGYLDRRHVSTADGYPTVWVGLGMVPREKDRFSVIPTKSVRFEAYDLAAGAGQITRSDLPATDLICQHSELM